LSSKKHLPTRPEGQEPQLLGRRCALATLTAAALAGCFVGEIADQDAGTDAGDDAAPDGGDEASCASSLGKKVGAETSFPVGTWKLVSQLIVAQDANGFFAFTAICTHAGCLVDPPLSNGSTFCPCHGSRFDGNGNVIAGPAISPLRHFEVNVCNGDVYVNTAKTVVASTRTPA
jgi:Rieske Fe-S protein